MENIRFFSVTHWVIVYYYIYREQILNMNTKISFFIQVFFTLSGESLPPGVPDSDPDHCKVPALLVFGGPKQLLDENVFKS